MTDILKTYNDVQRKAVAQAQKRAREQPGAVIAGEALGQILMAQVLHRVFRSLIPLKRRHWFLLLAVFGQRSPAYNLVWQQPSVKPRSGAAEALGKTLKDELVKVVQAKKRPPVATGRMTLDDVIPGRTWDTLRDSPRSTEDLPGL